MKPIGILLLILSITSFGQANDFQDSLTKLSTLSSVISALSILEKDTKSSALVDKLAGIKGVDKLIRADIRKAPGRLVMLKTLISDKKTAGDKAYEGVKALEGLMGNHSDFNKIALSVDQSVSAFEQLIREVEAFTDTDNTLKVEPYQSLITAFEVLIIEPGTEFQDMKKLRDSMALIKNQNVSNLITDVISNTDKFKTLLSVIPASDPINKSMTIVPALSRIQSLPDSLSVLSTRGAADIEELYPVISDLSSLISAPPTDNIDNIEDTLMDPWLKKVFPEFEKLEQLIRTPKFLSFSKKIKVIKDSIDKIRTDKEFANIAVIKESFYTTAEASMQLQKAQNPERVINLIRDCLQMKLKPTDTHLNLLELQKAQNYTLRVSEAVGSLEDVLKAIQKLTGLQKAAEQLEKIQKEVKTFDYYNDPNENVADRRLQILGIDKGGEVIRMLKEVKNRLDGFSADKLRVVISTDKPNWAEFRKIQRIHAESSLQDFMSCIASGTELIRKVIRFCDCERRIQDVDSVISWVGALGEAKKALEEDVGRRRRREDLESPQIAEHVVEDLAKGVQVLRGLQKTYENRYRIQKLLNLDPTTQNTLAPDVWTLENRLSLGKLITDLETLNSLSVLNDSLSEVFRIFPEAAKVTGAPVDAGKIARTLSFDPIIQTDFEEAAELQLDFSRGSLDLKAAAMTLPMVLDFIDTFFNPTSSQESLAVNPGTTATTEAADPMVPCVGVGAALLLALAVLLGWFGWRKYRTLQRWKNRDKYWSHAAFRQLIEGDNVHTNFVLAARSGNLEAVTKLIKLGAYVDINYLGYTPLHAAVDYFQPQIVELLIRAGANRTMINAEKETPLDLLYFRLNGNSQEEEQMQKLERMRRIFEKHENKTYRPRIPDLLAVTSYGINVQALNGNLIKFREVFREMIIAEDSDKPTTHYIVDTNSQGIFDIDRWMKDSENFMIQACLPIFTRCVLVGNSWIEACLQNRKNLHNDYEHRVKIVKFRGRLYESMDEWKKCIHRQTLPFLRDVHVQFLSQNPVTDVEPLKSIVETCGAQYHASIFNDPTLKAPLPYFHPNLRARWIICGEETSGILKALFRMPYADAESEYTIMKLPEFFEFLLERRSSSEREMENTIWGSSRTGTPSAGTPVSQNFNSRK